MFVRIVNNDGGSALYQCQKVFTHNLKNEKEDEPDSVLFTIDNGEVNGPFCIEIPKDSQSEVYLMNDEGKTIDSYRWRRTTPIDVGID